MSAENYIIQCTVQQFPNCMRAVVVCYYSLRICIYPSSAEKMTAVGSSHARVG